MKKLNIVKVLFAAASLALVLPGCSDLGEESTAQTQVTKDGKVAVSLSVSENYRTIVSSVDTSGLAYKLVIADTDDSTAEGYEEPKTVELSSLTGTKVYLTADKTYSFALTGYTKDTDGNATETAIVATRTAVTKKITASDATVSLTLQAVTTATVNVTLDVTYGTGYGVSAVSATVYDDSALTTAATDTLTLNSENEKNSDKTDGEVEFTGTIATGSTKWVRIALSDGTKEIGGKTIALYGIPTGDLSGEVNAIIKEYKATVNLTADTKPASLTLKNKDFEDNVSYTGISLTTTSTDKPYVFTGYVPMGEYNVYNETTNIGQISNTSALSVDTSVSLTSVAVAWKADDTTTDTQNVTLYAASSADDTTLESKLKDALVVTATMSNGTQPVSSYTITDFDPTKTDAQNVTISYTYNGVTKTAIISVKLTAVVLESIEVDSTSSLKTTYTEGDELDLTGLVLALTYNDTSKNITVAYTKPDAESGEAGNVNDFVVTVYSDSGCTTPVTGAFSELGVADYYVKVTYAELTTVAIQVKVAAGSTYILKADSATISLMKTEFGTISTAAQSGGKAYLTAATDNWNSSTTYTYSDDSISYTGQAYNMSGTTRIVTLKASSVAAFRIYARGGENRKYTVTVGDTLLGTQTLASGNVEKSPLFYTGDTGEVSIKLAGTSGSVYPVCITVYSETAVLNLVKAEFEALKATVTDITEAHYWSGYNAIVEKRDVDTTDYATVAQYNAAISDLQSAIAAAVKYVAPTAITVTYADTPVENGAELSFSKASGNTLTLTAKENEGSTGSLAWTVEGIEGISKEVSVADGVSTCVISGIESTGTINVTVEDKDSRIEGGLSVAFIISVSAQETKVATDDVITVTASADSVYVLAVVNLTAVPEKAYSENVTYQWYRNGAAIDGATALTYSYTTTADDVGSLVFSFAVTGSEATATGTTTIAVVIPSWKLQSDDSVIAFTSGTYSLANQKAIYLPVSYIPSSSNNDVLKIEFTVDEASAASDENKGNYICGFAASSNGSTIDASGMGIFASSRGVSVGSKIWSNGGATNGYSSYLKSVTDGVTITCVLPLNTTDKVEAWATGKTETVKKTDKVPVFSKTADDTAYLAIVPYIYNKNGEAITISNVKVYVSGTAIPTSADAPSLPDPNTTIDVSSGIYSDITLIQDDSNANTFTVAGAPVTASGSEIAWLVDGDAVENESAATFTLTGKTTGEWYVVTVKVTTADNVVYTKTASVLYIGN